MPNGFVEGVNLRYEGGGEGEGEGWDLQVVDKRLKTAGVHFIIGDWDRWLSALVQEADPVNRTTCIHILHSS